MNRIEQLILEARAIGLSFSQLEKDELQLAADRVVLNGSAISGCPTPITEGFATVLSYELIEFIMQYGYSNFTLEEVLVAMRMNASNEWRWPSGDSIDRIEFTGTCFNVAYLSKMLHPYRVIRNNLDDKIKNKLSGH